MTRRERIESVLLLIIAISASIGGSHYLHQVLQMLGH
jgi:hypothetical protein